MQFPLSFWDISLWLAFISIILLTTSEVLSQRYGKVRIYLNRKRLRNVALIVSTLLVMTIAIKIMNILTDVTY